MRRDIRCSHDARGRIKLPAALASSPAVIGNVVLAISMTVHAMRERPQVEPALHGIAQIVLAHRLLGAREEIWDLSRLVKWTLDLIADGRDRADIRHYCIKVPRREHLV